MRATPCEKMSVQGIDAVRPVTFGCRSILEEPTEPQGWDRLIGAIETAAMNGALAYRRAQEQVVSEVLAVRTPGQCLHVISMHDTMNYKMDSKGALSILRAPEAMLPLVANLGNLGDARGEPVPGGVTTMSGQEIRRVHCPPLIATSSNCLTKSPVDCKSPPLELPSIFSASNTSNPCKRTETFK